MPLNNFLPLSVSDTENVDISKLNRPKTLYLDSSITLTNNSSEPIDNFLLNPGKKEGKPRMKKARSLINLIPIRPHTPDMEKIKSESVVSGNKSEPGTIPEIVRKSVDPEMDVTSVIKFVNSIDPKNGKYRRPFFKDSNGKSIDVDIPKHEKLESSSISNYGENFTVIDSQLEGIINAEEEDPFSFHKWTDLVDLHALCKKTFIIARVLTVDDRDPTHYFFSYYPAQYFNKILFRYDYEKKKIYRMSARNPIDSRLLIGSIEYFTISIQSPYRTDESLEDLKNRCNIFSRIHVTVSPEFFWEDQIASSKLTKHEIQLEKRNSAIPNFGGKSNSDRNTESHKIDIPDELNTEAGDKLEGDDITQNKLNSLQPNFRSSITILGESSVESESDIIASSHGGGKKDGVPERKSSISSSIKSLKQKRPSSISKVEKKHKRNSKIQSKRISKFLETGDINQLKKMVSGAAKTESNNTKSLDSVSLSINENSSITSATINKGMSKNKYSFKEYAKKSDKENSLNASIYDSKSVSKSRMYSPIEHGLLYIHLQNPSIEEKKVELSLIEPNNVEKGSINFVLTKADVIEHEIDTKKVVEKGEKNKLSVEADVKRKANVIVYEALFLCDDSELLSRPSLRDYFIMNELDDEYSMKICVQPSFGIYNTQPKQYFSLPHPRINGARIVILENAKQTPTSTVNNSNIFSTKEKIDEYAQEAELSDKGQIEIKDTEIIESYP
ncbi:hypothetical protein AYI70_g8938, partial [Smittium culicis]